MHKPKIAIIGEKFWPSRGGTSRIIEDTLVQLKDRYDFTMYCYEHPEAEGHIPEVKVVQFPPYPFGALGVFFFFLRCTLHALRQGNYDLIHVHKTDAAVFASRLARKYPVIATSHEAPYRRDKWSAVGKWYFRTMERIFMKSPATLTCISRPLTEYYQREYGREVMYIPNGVELIDSSRFNYEAADEVLARHGVSGDFIFFAARRIMGTKGAHHLLKALNLMGYKGTVVIAGDMDQLPAYTRLLQELSQTLTVKFIGFISNKETLLALVDRAQYFVFPSETEGMSIMLLEVASVGTPLICSDIPENTAVFDDREVLYFENKNAEDLRDKLVWCFEHADEMQQKAYHARMRVQEEYNRTIVVRHYVELYDRLTQAQPVA
ncbi:MAG: glycosyltransferase family 4 protein [Bacteroidia bacterium]|nr:glycosyltransferase family 4 protein [Bacteroidia bacterium]